MEHVRRRISNLIRQHHGNALIELGAECCRLYLKAYWNERYYTLQSNGELLVLNALAQVYGRGGGVVAFDVGANVGLYSEAILQSMPEATVHCFEIIPAICEDLHSRWLGNPAVAINDFGLSDQTANVDVSYFPDAPTEGSIQTRKHFERTEIVTGHVQRGDDYMADQGIDTVDFLKIDTEGHELFVLEGFSKALSDGRVTTIQFEYGNTWLAARVFLIDIYDLLSPLGYRIGRLFPDGVRFKGYDYVHDEHFRMGNYIAVHAQREDLIEVLELPSGTGR